MMALSETLAEARKRSKHVTNSAEARYAVEILASAGAQVGELQVECCAMSRMPLYAEILVELTKAQRALTRQHKLGH